MLTAITGGGNLLIIKTLGVWQRPEDIVWERLPERFVLKTTHGGGNIGVLVCKDKARLDKVKAVKRLRIAMQQDIYKECREWPYKGVEKRVFAEEYLEDKHGELCDYKFYCFDGVVRLVFVATGRQDHDEAYFNYFDRDYRPLSLTKDGHKPAPVTPEKPLRYDEMVQIAETLSAGFAHVRIDLYNVNGQIYFGEYTFYTGSGISPFKPSQWDDILGSFLHLPID